MSNLLSIVIDADIARASGTSDHPVSSGSRSLLEIIEKNGHRAAMSPTLMGEWKKHRSIYAATWLASMYAKKRVDYTTPKPHIHAFIATHITNTKDASIAAKDSHLVDLAFERDKLITSNDDNARKVFCMLSSSCKQLRDIKWFNAITDKDFVQEFLEGSIYVPEKYHLIAITSPNA